MRKLQNETCAGGVVAIDWVVLTAAVVGLAVDAYSTISVGAEGLTGETATYLTTQNLGGFANITP